MYKFNKKKSLRLKVRAAWNAIRVGGFEGGFNGRASAGEWRAVLADMVANNNETNQTAALRKFFDETLRKSLRQA
jgi:hypothetical protein